MSNKEKKSDKENKNSLSYAFKQQVMKAWQPVPTLNSTICLFLVLSNGFLIKSGLFFLIMGIILISYTDQIREHYQRYDALCQDLINKECVVEIALDKTFTGPVYIYYELSNFYQNHRRYVKSKSTQQLAGEDLSESELTDCDPVITNSQMGKKTSITGDTLEPNDPAIPCGLIAKSLFTDTFELYQRKSGKTKNITIYDTDIAWPSDRSGRYANVNPKKQWTNITNGIDILYQRAFHGLDENSCSSNIQKVMGKNRVRSGSRPLLLQDIEQQNFFITSAYDVSGFDGQKALVLSTANAFGGRNTFLAIAYIVVGVICALITIGFLIRKLLANQEDKHK